VDVNPSSRFTRRPRHARCLTPAISPLRRPLRVPLGACSSVQPLPAARLHSRSVLACQLSFVCSLFTCVLAHFSCVGRRSRATQRSVQGSRRRQGRRGGGDQEDILFCTSFSATLPAGADGTRVQLARKYHPDTNPDKSAREKFQEIQEAYDVHTILLFFSELVLTPCLDPQRRQEAGGIRQVWFRGSATRLRRGRL
jgi:hypothetical protein